MEKTIEIQKEFETLVSELHRLKAVNELTASNAEASNKVIDEIDNFMSSAIDLKKSIADNMSEKNEKIDHALIKLDRAIITVESNSRKSLSEHLNKINELHDKSDALINENKTTFTTGLNKFINSSSKLREDISATVDNSSNTFTIKIEEHEKYIENYLTTTSKKITESVKDLEAIIESNFKEQKEYINQLISGLDDVENSVINHNKLLEDNLKNSHDINESINQNLKITEKSFAIQIFSFTIIIGILFIMLLK